MGPEEHNKPQRKTSVFMTDAKLTDPIVLPSLQECIQNFIKAVILVGTVNGTVPTGYLNFIKSLKDKGITVFVLSHNYEYLEGADSANYQNIVNLKESGAYILEKVNINGALDVQKIIDDKVDDGMYGEELGETVYEKYRFKEGEVRTRTVASQIDNNGGKVAEIL